MSPSLHSKLLIVAGTVLFLFGILQGAVVQEFVNPRMALSAHLTAVQSGMAVTLAGILWPNVTLSAIMNAAARWSIIVGMYGLWFGLTLSAATGAGRGLPIAGKGFSTGPSAEAVVSVIVLSSSAVIVLGWTLLVIGLVRRGKA